MAPRTPLLRPDSYFAERDLQLGRVLLVFGLVFVTGLGAVYGVGFLLADHIDGTVMVDNPERPPDMFCDDGADSAVFDKSDCDAPKEVERDVDPIIWDAIGNLAGPMFGGLFLLFGGLTLAIHAASWLAGGSKGLAASFGVTVWGLAPMVITIPLSLAALWVVLDPVTVTATQDPAGAFRSVESQLQANQWIGTVSTAVSTLWSAIIWRYGLEHERDLTAAGATAIAAVLAFLIILGGAL